MEEIISQICEKKEFSEIPISIINNVLKIKDIQNKSGKDKIKYARAFLRKYFSVFMTNRLVKGKLNTEEILKKHISTCNRNYPLLYERIINKEEIIIDLGAGLNGFSYNYFPKKVYYLGIEAIGVFVKLMNNYFTQNKLNAFAIQEDLFNLNKIEEIVSKKQGKKLIFLLNVIDALERIQKDYSKKLIFRLVELGERVVVSFPTKSITGKVKFKAKRFWLLNFLEDNFNILESFELGGERFIIFRKK
jgi:hypothetical protein